MQVKTFLSSLFLLIIIAFSIHTSAQTTTPSSLSGLDKFIEKELKKWNVAGVSVAVVKDGKPILTKGYGVKDIETKAPVTENTLFAIGSSSKAFTATTVMQLVDDGLIKLDEPVKTYLPDFQLFDEYATNHLTVRDLLCHRSGLPRHDLAWYGSTANREDLFQRLKFLKPTAELREAWQYQNLMYMTAGYLVGKIDQSTWEAFTKRRILDPLEMSNTNFSVDAMQQAQDFASPHEEKEGGVIAKLTFRNIDAIGPAGAINSNAVDMAKWLKLLLTEGNYEGNQIVQPASIKETFKPQMVMPGEVSDNDLFYSSYGLGWMITSYRGHLRIEHGGNIDGFSASVCVMPHDGFGVTVLTNGNATPLTGIIRNYIVDKLLELEPRDWSTELLNSKQKMMEGLEALEGQTDEVRVKDTKTSHPLADFTGIYSNDGYGEIQVGLSAKKPEGLFLSRGIDTLALSHYHYNIFVSGSTAEQFKVQFEMGLDGKIQQFKAMFEPSLDEPILFKKVKEEVKITENDLKKYEGKYELMGQVITFEVENGILKATVPGQPTYDLIPRSDHQFDLKGIEGYSVKFKIEGGKSTAATFIQPNGNFTATRQ